ncbi:DUF928 domain-containing protein [Pleurocapsa sp. PCC 7319]|uniref:DUF928 domain-containing protein n=1 Tax=Pleurocapsa sp. PCC 7319 TaxID=118161 RepID=UPI0003452CC7|nr:DUF928 domain-containing protein [Pleurocapsa sp. PCC 7319]
MGFNLVWGLILQKLEINYYAQIKSFLSIILACLVILYLSTKALSTEKHSNTSSPKTARENTKPQKKEEREESLDFSSTGRPGQQTAGESRGNCTNINDFLKAVMPVSHSGKTILGHPSFWVYLPLVTEQASHIEFIVQNEAREDIWRSQIHTPQDGRYHKFSLPETEPPLKIGQWYLWYVKIYCNSQLASSQYVQGWVRRVPVTSGLYLELQQNGQRSHLTYANHGIWYDAIDKLLSQYKPNSSDLDLEKDWKNLIRAKGVQLHHLPCIRANFTSRKQEARAVNL